MNILGQGADVTLIFNFHSVTTMKKCPFGNLSDWREEVQKSWVLPSVRVKSLRCRGMQRKERVMLVGFAQADI